MVNLYPFPPPRFCHGGVCCSSEIYMTSPFRFSSLAFSRFSLVEIKRFRGSLCSVHLYMLSTVASAAASADFSQYSQTWDARVSSGRMA